MNLYDILKIRGFNMNAKTKMLRHHSNTYDTDEIFERGYINTYQSVQSKDVLNCEYLIAFIGRGRTKACFVGIWEVKGQIPFKALNISDGFPYPDFFSRSDDIYYDLQKVGGYDDLIGRLIIDWGTGTRSWHQWLKDKPIVELQPQGQVKPFPGYLDFVLSFNQLSSMVLHQGSNRVWHQMLGSVAGIYLITDNRTGQHYVGSAYGKEGILGRWKTYAQSGHGGNQDLKRLLSKDQSVKYDLSFTILRTLPRTLTQKEVIAKEQLYKLKLGSRVHGLNLN